MDDRQDRTRKIAQMARELVEDDILMKTAACKNVQGFGPNTSEQQSISQVDSLLSSDK
jgi:hypothetical protein